MILVTLETILASVVIVLLLLTYGVAWLAATLKRMFRS